MSIYLHTYNSSQFLISFIGGYELPTKCITMVSINDFNDDGTLFRSFITLSRFCTKFNIFHLSACWHVIPPLLVCLNLTNMVQRQ
jgi:hypothetical protein